MRRSLSKLSRTTYNYTLEEKEIKDLALMINFCVARFRGIHKGPFVLHGHRIAEEKDFPRPERVLECLGAELL